MKLTAITDELTQLVNREYFNTLFENELARAIRHKRDLSCAMIEIDCFKKIKDKYGHQFSDEVLQEAAEDLSDELRRHDILARDDDRFICLMPETHIESALHLLQRIRSLVKKETFSSGEDDKTIHITVSIGVTSCESCKDKEKDIEKIIIIADEALNIAKGKGGNRVEYLIGE